MGRVKKNPEPRHTAIYLLINRKFQNVPNMVERCCAYYRTCLVTRDMPEYTLYIDHDHPGEARDRLVIELKAKRIDTLITFSIDMFITVDFSSYEIFEDYLKKIGTKFLAVKEAVSSDGLDFPVMMIGIARDHASQMVGEHYLQDFTAWLRTQDIHIDDDLIFQFLDQCDKNGKEHPTGRTWEDVLL